MKSICTLDDIDLENKKVLLRLDLNSPVEKNRIVVSPRILEHAKTVKELHNRNSKICIIAHQGRPNQKDFTSLRQHSDLLSKVLNLKVKYIDDLYGDKALTAINKLKNKEIILLKNLRSSKYEVITCSATEHARSPLVRTLSKQFDIFVQDAFSILHRKQASILGFPKTLPTYVGRVLEDELKALKKLKVKNSVYILGGAKPSDHISLLKHLLKERKAKKILTAGVLGEAFLISKGVNLGKKKKYLEDLVDSKLLLELKKLIEKYSNLIETPIDFAIEDKKRKEITLKDLPSDKNMFDIGKKTIKKYKKIIEESEVVFMKGTPGKYLDKLFILGTKELLNSISKAKFSFVGGGDTTTAIKMLKMENKFSYRSLSGGALLAYLSGKKLPGLEIINKKNY